MTTSTASPLRSKALSVLREGRLTVLRADCVKQSHVVDQVIARVRSSRQGGPAYAVDFLDGVWDCTCTRPAPCAHVAAVQLVTGHAGAAVRVSA
jgi:hypothetical protein